MRGRRIVSVALLVSTLVLLLPAAGQARPPEDDGSTYTWAGATTLTVDVEPWGGGYVRSAPYLIDCPLACVRPFDAGREVTLTAYATPGFTFERWTGACADQPNPCRLTTAGAAMDVTAVYSGHYVPPGPSLILRIDGTCPGCTARAIGVGFHPNSSITLSGVISSPPIGSFVVPNFATTDAAGTWSYQTTLTCDFGDGAYTGPFVEDITATDAKGASASGRVTATCVEPT